MRTLEEIKAALEQEEKKARSAWARGVVAYAFMICDKLEEYDGKQPANNAELLEMALNGAKDWKQASAGGSFLCYNVDIARTLCNPSELKKAEKKGFCDPANSSESWLDVQARALLQAYNLIKSAANN